MFVTKIFPMVLFIMLYKVLLTFLICGLNPKVWPFKTNERYWAILPCGTVYYAVQGGSNFRVYGWNCKVWPFKKKATEQYFLWYCLLRST